MKPKFKFEQVVRLKDDPFYTAEFWFTIQDYRFDAVIGLFLYALNTGDNHNPRIKWFCESELKGNTE